MRFFTLFFCFSCCEWSRQQAAGIPQRARTINNFSSALQPDVMKLTSLLSPSWPNRDYKFGKFMQPELTEPVACLYVAGCSLVSAAYFGLTRLAGLIKLSTASTHFWQINLAKRRTAIYDGHATTCVCVCVIAQGQSVLNVKLKCGRQQAAHSAYT